MTRRSRGLRLSVEQLDGRIVPNAAPVPQLNSLLGAAKVLYLDFDGSTGVTVPFNLLNGSPVPGPVNTPAYSLDADTSSFSAAELASIRNIWATVAEDFAPFNINVTTVRPSAADLDRQNYVAQILIGGRGPWFNTAQGQNNTGAAPGSFGSDTSDIGFVFPDTLQGQEQAVATTVSHEAGHIFLLDHQGQYGVTDGNGNVVNREYSIGTAAWSPIMGSSQSRPMVTWHNGTTTGPNTFQDDIDVLGRVIGYRSDDVGNTAGTARAMTVSGNRQTASGLVNATIAGVADVDAFSFTTAAGTVTATVRVAQPSPNLDAVLELRDAAGTLIATANPTDSFDATITRSLTAGSYRLFVRSNGVYGRIGQYTLEVSTATVVAPRVTATSPTGSANTSAGFVDFTFDRDMNQSSFSTAADLVSFTGPGGANLAGTVTGFAWRDDRTLRVTFSTQTAAGAYTMVIGPQVLSTAGVALDQDNDGTAGEATQDRATASFTLTAAAIPADRYETNDTFATATNFGTVSDRTDANLSIHTANNSDYYRFVAAASGTQTVALTFSHAAGDVDLEVFSASQTRLGGSTGVTNTETFSFSVTAGQTYFVRVYGAGAVNPNYTLTLDGPAVPGDRFEANNSFAAATNFGTLGSRAETGLSIHAANNDDYYRFVAGATGSGTVSLAFADSAGDLNLFLYDAGQNLIRSSTGTSDTESVSAILTAGQTYYIRVVGFGGALNADYSLAISGPGFQPDALESNNTQGTATNLGTTNSASRTNLSIHNLNDNDWFRFTPATTGLLTISLSFSNQLGQVGGFVYNDLNIPVGGLFGSNGASYTDTFVAGWTYTILIAPVNDGYSPNYSLQIQPGEYAADRFESAGNGGFATATNLGTTSGRTERTLSLHNSGDEDYFRFQVPVGGTVTVSTATLGLQIGDADLFVYDANRVLIGQSTRIGTSEQVTFTARAGQVYYIRVGNAGQAIPDYQLEIAVPATQPSFVAAAAPGVGVYTVSNGRVALLTTAFPNALAANASGMIAANFPGYGVMRYTPGVGWVVLNGVDANAVAIDAAGNVAASFPGFGIGLYRPGIGWEVILPNQTASQLEMDANGGVYATPSGGGIWRYRLTTGWVQLFGVAPSVFAVNGAGAVAANFPGYGVHLLPPGGGWTLINGTVADDLAINEQGDVIASFRSAGVGRYVRGQWLVIHPIAVPRVGLSASGRVIGRFPGFGVGEYTPEVGWGTVPIAEPALLVVR